MPRWQHQSKAAGGERFDQAARPGYPQRMSMPPVLTETARPSRSRTAETQSKTGSDEKLRASQALEILEQHLLLDGFRIVLDDERSRGSYLYNAASGSRPSDLYGFFRSVPGGYKHSPFCASGRPKVPAPAPPSQG